MKKILFVVDEKCVGGVSTLLTDILNMSKLYEDNEVDLLVLHNRGEGLKNLPKEVNIIYGTKYFNTVDISIKEIIKKKEIKLLFNKFRLVFEMKTGLIKKRIIKERNKMLSKKYDFEIAFKDGFTAIFTAYGDSLVKYHWIQFNFSKSDPTAKYRKLFTDVLPRFNKIISVSDGIKKDFNKIYNLGSKVIIIENLVDTKRIKNLAKKNSDVKLNKNQINLISVGRLSNNHKGYDRLVNAVAKLNGESLFDNTVLRIYGDGPDKNALEEQIKNLGLTDKIILYGMVDNPYKYFKGNDLFILSSRYEAFGLVLVESLTLGVPVLATKNDATSFIIDNNKNGLIVDNSNEGLYNGLKDLITNKEKLDIYKNNLKKYEYNNTEILDKILELFK